MLRISLLCLGATLSSLWLHVPVAGQFFALAMALDIATGVLLAGRKGLWSSQGMSPGLRIKGGEALLIGLLFLIENRTHAPLGSGVAGWFAFRELGSSLENLSRLGVRLPPWLERALAGIEREQLERISPPNEQERSNDIQPLDTIRQDCDQRPDATP